MTQQTATRWRMPLDVANAFANEIRRAHSAVPLEQRWDALERAHILSQPWPIPHVRSHAAMMRLAIRERDTRELLGQVVRIVVAGPASAVGKYPAGNTGRARVPATLPMPITDDLARLLEAAP